MSADEQPDVLYEIINEVGIDLDRFRLAQDAAVGKELYLTGSRIRWQQSPPRREPQESTFRGVREWRS